MLSKNAEILLKQRYCRLGEQPQDVFKRVAKALSLGDERFEKALLKLMLDGVFLPASPTLRNAGIKKTLLHPCHVLPIYDSIDSIFECIKNSAVIFHYGGGVGYNMSELRPKGFPLSSGGESSGVVSFLEIFDKVTDVVRQGGFRRGASLAVLDYDHPEIENFITSKLSGKLSNFNISVLVNDKFMSKINSEEKIDLKFNKKIVGSIKAKDIFDLISYSAYLTGDPGLLFYDRINQDNKLFSTGAEIKACNPCLSGDSLVAVADGRNAVSIRQLAEEGKDVPVYCFDNGTKIRMMRNPRITGLNQPILKIGFDDGSFMRCTSNHSILLRSGGYKEAKDLQIGDGIERFDSVIGDKGYRLIRRKNDSFSLQYDMIYQYFTNGGKKKGMHVHHRDFDKTNDFFDNLKGLTISEHSITHDISGDKNPVVRFPERNIFNNPEFQKKSKEFHTGRKRNEDTCRKISENCILAWKDPELKLRHSEATKEGMQRNYDKFMEALSKRVYKEDSFSKRVYRKGHRNQYSKPNEWFAPRQVSNHKVESIEFCGYEDVYNGTVDDVHNFGVITSRKDDKFMESSGAFVKNCGEVPLLPWNCCNLGAINLSKFVNKDSFDFKRFSKVVELGIRTLRNINSIGWYPFPEMSKQMKFNDPCGLGFLGFADCLIKLGIYYNSDEAIRFIDEICKPYVEITDRLAPESFYKRSQQPTGSLSILADASPGIEPVFHREFERRLSVGVIEEVRSLYKSQYCRTAHEISPEWHLKIQAAFQKYIDAGVSKTCNISNGSSVEEIRQIYILAHKMGVKGITVFRDNCKDGQQVIVKKQCDDSACYL